MSPTKRVLFCSHTAERKGSAMSMQVLAESLDPARYSAALLYAEAGDLVDSNRAAGFPVKVVPRWKVGGWLTVLRLWWWLGRNDIDLLYLNCAMTWCRLVGKAARLRGLPVIWHVREPPKSSRVRKQVPWFARLARRVLVVSHEQEELLAEAGVTTTRIPNGVGIEAFAPPADQGPYRQALGLAPEALVFAIVGTVEPRKGIADFIDAAASIATNCADARFLIVGDGPVSAAQALDTQLAGYPQLADRVFRTGRVSNVRDMLWASDLLVMPSTWEGFPRSLIEAMAAGLPAIASDVGDSRWILKHGEMGWIVQHSDSAALLAAMQEAVASRAQLPAMGQAARAWVSEQYPLSRYAQRMQAQFDEVLQESS